MTDVEFFFDPSCPWTWVTSRWLVSVAADRQLSITWRPWSLVMKNADQALPPDLTEARRERIVARQAFCTSTLRVLEATGTEAGNEACGRLYTEMGRRWHGEGGPETPPRPDRATFAADSLAAAGLPADLARAGDDPSWDKAIARTMDDVRPEVGDDVGVPIVGIRQDGRLRAIAGPVINQVPPQDRALVLWDTVATLTAEPTLYELKRHRTGHPEAPALDADGARR